MAFEATVLHMMGIHIIKYKGMQLARCIYYLGLPTFILGYRFYQSISLSANLDHVETC